MHRSKLILAFLAIAIASFVLGHRLRPGDARQAATGMPASTTPATDQMPAAQAGQALSKEPPQTYRGPDGLPHLIVYNQDKPGDNQDPVQIQAAMMADMRNHPVKIAGDYGIALEQVQRIAAGDAEFPKELLPRER